MERDYTCLRCGGKMCHAFTENLQLGKTSWLWGDLPNLVAGGMLVAVYRCESCGKLEFFTADEGQQNTLPQVTCPNCGHSHDFDYPACPFCKYKYN